MLFKTFVSLVCKLTNNLNRDRRKYSILQYFPVYLILKEKNKPKTEYLHINRVVVNLVISPQIDFSSLPLSLRSFYYQTKEALIKAKVEDKVSYQ